MDSFRKKVNINYKKEEFECFPIDWIECDEGCLIEEEEERYYEKNYKILLFANTVEGHSVSIKVNNFHPYFYLKIPDEWNNDDIEKFRNTFIDTDEINLVEGDIVIQRGTNHAWTASGEEPALFIAVLIDSMYL